MSILIEYPLGFEFWSEKRIYHLLRPESVRDSPLTSLALNLLICGLSERRSVLCGAVPNTVVDRVQSFVQHAMHLSERLIDEWVERHFFEKSGRFSLHFLPEV